MIDLRYVLELRDGVSVRTGLPLLFGKKQIDNERRIGYGGIIYGKRFLQRERGRK